MMNMEGKDTGTRLPDNWDSMMKGITPSLRFEPVRQTPRPDLIKTIRDYVNSRLKPQQEIANEIGLSRTKMSQFMNNAKRVKGWGEVEAKLDRWLKGFNKSKSTAHNRFLDKLYNAKTGKPDRPVVENVYRRTSNTKSSSGSSSPSQEILTFINDGTSEEEKTSYNSLSDLEEDMHIEPSISVPSKESEPVFAPIEEKDEAGWSSFEIGKVFPL